MVVHCHLTVNGKKVNKPSFEVRVGDVITLREKSQQIENYKNWFHFFEQQLDYIQRDPKKLSGSLVRIPEREEVPILLEDQLVVEFMARG